MHEGTRIDNFTVAINLDTIVMEAKAKIGRGNWITGFSTKVKSLHFTHQRHRKAELILGASSAITKNHHLDCTNQIEIGCFTTVAGYNSQFLTHSINVLENRQDSEPIKIGDYCFIGTNVVVLGGATLPSYSVLGAKSLLNKSHTAEWTLYGGVPSKPIQLIPTNAKYFSRYDGFVH
jgi:acetyltransferase-like isoleucine patch superfamily enzyme